MPFNSFQSMWETCLELPSPRGLLFQVLKIFIWQAGRQRSHGEVLGHLHCGPSAPLLQCVVEYNQVRIGSVHGLPGGVNRGQGGKD